MSLFSFNIKKAILFLSLFAINAATQAQNALLFNGSTSYVEIPYAATNNPAQFTVEFWARVDGGAGVFRSPLSNRNYPPVVTGFNFYATPANIWSFTGGNGSGVWSALDGPAVIIGQWTHLAATYDGTTYRFYVNGVLVKTLEAVFSVNTSRPMRIGAGRTEGGPLYYFPGAVDEVKIWNYARSASQINDNKNVNLVLPQTGLASYYQFEDGLATSKTGSNNGTLINAPTSVTGVSFTIAPTITNFNNITKTYFDASYTIAAPTSNSSGAFTYTSNNSAVATVSGTTVTLLGAGTATITATQAGDATYETSSITSTLTVNAVTLLTNTGAISSTNLNYINKYGQIGGNFGLSATGAILNAKSVDLSGGLDVMGAASNGLSFSASLNNYAYLPSATYFSGDFTIECWVYVTSHTNWSRIIDFGNGAGNNNVLFSTSDGTSGKPGFYVGGVQFAANDQIPLNQWTHLAATLSGNTATIYINGVASGTANFPVPANVIRNNNYIGRSNWGWGDPAPNAIFDDLRIWNVAKTAPQILASKNNELMGSESGLVAYFKFNEGVSCGNNSSITTLVNSASSGAAYNATLNGFTLNGGCASNFVAK